MSKMGFSKISVCFCAFLFLVIAHKINAENVRDNIYLGLGITDSISHFDLTTSTPASNIVIKRKKNHNDVLGNVFLGYGYTTCRSFYIAAELGTNFPKRSGKIHRPGASLTSFTFVNRISIQDYLTGDILLGYRPLECLLVYLRGGASYGRLELHQFENTDANTPTFDADKKAVSGRFGVGINYGITKHFGLGLDYVFTRYQNLHPFWPDFNLQFKEKTYANNICISGIYSF
jgi:opacity protein-like surface antigen